MKDFPQLEAEEGDADSHEPSVAGPLREASMPTCSTSEAEVAVLQSSQAWDSASQTNEALVSACWGGLGEG